MHEAGTSLINMKSCWNRVTPCDIGVARSALCAALRHQLPTLVEIVSLIANLQEFLHGPGNVNVSVALV